MNPSLEVSADSALAWLRLAKTPGIGPVAMDALLERFGTPENILGASAEDLGSVMELRPPGRREMLRTQQGALEEAVSREWETLSNEGIRLLPCSHPEFPAPLRNIPARPTLLFVRGTLLPQDINALGVVGTRRCDSYGLRMTRHFCGELAGQGMTIVSGLALGIDGAAHQAALQAGGRTLAFLPSGFGQVYPPDHRAMAEEIAEKGALLTEFCYDDPPLRRNFPSRNRLISGASLGILVVQAPEKSGALITARTALEQNREVFALPGRVDEPGSQGPHRLIQDGAKLVREPEDILEELKHRLSFSPQVQANHPISPPPPREKRPSTPRPSTSERSATVPKPKRIPDHLGPEDKRIAQRLAAGPVHIDRLAADLDLPVRKVSERLLQLEMLGIIQRLPGMHFDLT